MSKKDYVAIANQYIDDVLSEKIPACKELKQAVQRQKDDLERWKTEEDEYYFVPEMANKICAFIENLPHIKGIWEKKGLLITLEPWQIFIWTTVFGWYKTNTWSRRFRECYLEVPRKNSKSTQAAGVGLFMFVEDGESGAEVYSGATSESQAKEVFTPARLMAKKAEGFLDHYGIEVNVSNLSIIDSASKFSPVIGKPGDGASPHCSIIDEYHQHSGPDLYDTMVTGMGSRIQPLNLIITTAGTDTSSPCFDKRNQVCKILDGTFDNEEIFGIIFTIDKDDDWSDFEVWKKANPNFGVSVFEDYLRSQHRSALQRASQQNMIRCKHLNQWCNAGTAFFNMFEWDNCCDKSLKIEDFKGEECWLGVDLASKIDITVLLALFKRDNHYYIFAKHYLPEERTEGQDMAHYAGWAKEGWIITTMGNMVDYEIIQEDILDFCKDYDVLEVDHDPWNAPQLIGNLQKRKITCVEIPQTINFMSDPMKEMEGLVLSNRIHHNGDPVLKWMASNTCGRYDKKDNVFPFKERNESKIDGVVATLNALNRAIVSKKHGSKYEKKGLTII
jgi:phage terminase large subunit-like protein